MTLDARDGLQVDATGRLEDVALLRPEGGEPFAIVPNLTAEIAGFGFRDGEVQLMRLAVDGAMSVREASMKSGGPLSVVHVAGAACPISRGRPGRPAGSTCSPACPEAARSRSSGTVQPPPAASQLRLRLKNLELGRWAEFVPVAARVSGHRRSGPAS